MDSILAFSLGSVGSGLAEVYRIKKIIQKGGDFYYPKKMILISIVLALGVGLIVWCINASSPIDPLPALWIGLASDSLIGKFIAIFPPTKEQQE